MAPLLDFLMPNGWSPDQVRGGGLLGNLQPPQQQQQQPQMSGAAAMPGEAAGQGGGGGLGKFLSSNPMMLMALGGGIAQGGIGRGLQMAVPAMQAEQQQQKQQQAQGATYHALRSAGVPHGQALASALNPEILKTIARSHFDAKPTFETIGHDQHGQPTYGFIDTARKSVTPYQQPNMTSLNTVIGHLGNLMEASNKLDNNGDVSLGGQTIKETKSAAKSSDPGLARVPHDVAQVGQARLAAFDGFAARNFELARNAVADEMAKVLRSSGMSDEDLRSWKDTLSTSNSPTELRAVIRRSMELMSSRLTALKDQHARATGRPAPEWLSPKSRATLEKIRQWAGEESPDQQSAP